MIPQLLLGSHASQRDDGIQMSFWTPDGRDTEGETGETPARRRKRTLVLTPALLLALFRSSFVFQKKKKEKKNPQKSSAKVHVFFNGVAPPFCLPLHPHATSHSTLILHSFILSFSTIVVCFCGACVRAECVCDGM